MEPGCSGRAARTLNLWAISPAPDNHYFKISRAFWIHSWLRAIDFHKVSKTVYVYLINVLYVSPPYQQRLAFPMVPTAQLPCSNVKTTCASSHFGYVMGKMTVSTVLMRRFTCAVRGRGRGWKDSSLLGHIYQCSFYAACERGGQMCNLEAWLMGNQSWWFHLVLLLQFSSWSSWRLRAKILNM
jgi:hypothetical protein